MHPDDSSIMHTALNLNKVGETVKIEFEQRFRHKEGHWFWGLARGKAVDWDGNGNPLRVADIPGDHFGRKLAEIEREPVLHSIATPIIRASVRDKQALVRCMNTARKRLHGLSRYLVEVQDDVRRRLAGELHDRTSPNLAVIKINLKIIAASLGSNCIPEIRERMEDTCALIEDTDAGIREISLDLRSSALDYVGLAAAFKTHAQRYTERTGIIVEVNCGNDESRLAPALESPLFRIFQEALTNSLKHSCAKTVKVMLNVDASMVVLNISDDGIGYYPDQVGLSGRLSGLGMRNMREMAELAGGKMLVKSAPGLGSHIVVTIDL